MNVIGKPDDRPQRSCSYATELRLAVLNGNDMLSTYGSNLIQGAPKTRAVFASSKQSREERSIDRPKTVEQNHRVRRMQYQVNSQPLDPDFDAAETHPCFEARHLLTHVRFRKQRSAANAEPRVHGARGLELGGWSMAEQLLSCEDFDEDDCK